jgi:hypothetical protein
LDSLTFEAIDKRSNNKDPSLSKDKDFLIENAMLIRHA